MIDFVGVDQGSGRGRDSDAWCHVRAEGELLVVVATAEWRSRKGAPIVRSKVRDEIVSRTQNAGADAIACDLYGIEDLREDASAAGLTIFELPNGQPGKVAQYTNAREIINAARVRIPERERKLIAQLKAIISRPAPGGGTVISSPRNASGHGDLASAFVAALWRADRVARREARGDDVVLFRCGRWSESNGRNILRS